MQQLSGATMPRLVTVSQSPHREESAREAELGGAGRGWGCARGVMVSAWQKCQYHTDAHWAQSQHTLVDTISVHSTQTNSLVVTSEWELLLSQPHIPSRHSLPTTHCTLHVCTPLSAAGHMTTLLGGRSLVWLVGSFAGDAPHSTHPLQSGCHKGGGDHLTPSALRGPHPLEWTSTGGHPIVIGMCACVCCVCGPCTGASLAVTTHRVVAVWG